MANLGKLLELNLHQGDAPACSRSCKLRPDSTAGDPSVMTDRCCSLNRGCPQSLTHHNLPALTIPVSTSEATANLNPQRMTCGASRMLAAVSGFSVKPMDFRRTRRLRERKA